MGTPATISIRNADNQVLGCRVNYDGYPSHIGPFLAALVARHNGDVEELMVELLAHSEWSSVSSDHRQAPDLRFVNVAGVGRAYGAGEASPLIRGPLENAFGEDYAYVFSGDGEWLDVYAPGGTTSSAPFACFKVADLADVLWDRL